MTLNMYLTVGLAIGVYYLGVFIVNNVYIIRKYLIPAPVVGGIVIALIILLLRVTGILTIEFDATFQTFFMLLFFSSIGFNGRINMIRKGGILLVIMIIAVTILIIIENLVGAGIVTLFGEHPLLGVAIGSVPLVGGHGTAAAFGPLIEAMGVPHAETASYAAATYGLVAGCMIGGPLAYLRIKNLKKSSGQQSQEFNAKSIDNLNDEHLESKPLNQNKLMLAFSLLLLCVGAGTVITGVLEQFMTFSAAVGALLAGLIVRNICDFKRIRLPDKEINITGDIFLNIFLAMAMMNMKLWELIDLAGPMVVTLLVQTIIVALFAYYVIYNIMGRDYESSVILSGVCGFGLGATPNAIANMDAITGKYGPAPQAFLIIPIVGSMFADIVNAFVITFFMNIFG